MRTKKINLTKFSCQLVKYLCYHKGMKSLTVGEFKAQFSEVLALIQQGESVGVLYGKSKKPVAKLVPMSGSDTKKGGKRKLGILDGKMKVVFSDDFKMTEEEFISLKI